MAAVESIYRYPVKGLSPERLDGVRLEPGETLPADRQIRPSRTGPPASIPPAPAYFPRTQFLMLMRNERLATLDTRYDDASHVLTIRGEGRELARGDLSTREGRLAIEAFFRRFMPAELRGPPKVLQADGHSFSDVAAKVVSIINPCLGGGDRDRGRRSGPSAALPRQPLCDGWPAWHEFSLVGQEIAIGAARLQVTKPYHAVRGHQCRSGYRTPRSRDSRDADADLRSRGLRDLCAGHRGSEIKPGDAIATP
jgi:uncharacterized protein YcbX